jgi:predicted nucleotidyltransferase
LQDLVAWLEAEGVPGVIIGGLAVALLGRPRVTRDVDLVVLLPEDRWKGFLSSGLPFGFVPRGKDTLAFAHQARVLLVRHRPTAIDVDISLGALPFEQELLARAVAVDLGGIRVPLPTPEDLIITKAVAHRPQDLADIESILDAHSSVDRRRVRRWVREFASALEAPELIEDLETILSRRRKGRKR